MIVTCESCGTRYLVADYLLGPEGRRVRCTVCAHEWYQGPFDGGDDERGQGDTASFKSHLEDLEPIPEKVRPMAEGSALPVIPGEHGGGGVSIGTVLGAGTAALVAALFFGALVLLHTPVVKLWPATIVFYDLVGIETPIEGEGLNFASVRAESGLNEEGVKILRVRGELINLKNETVHLPPVKASLLLEGGTVADSWLVDMPQEMIDPQGSVTFMTTYPEVSKDIKEAKLELLARR